MCFRLATAAALLSVFATASLSAQEPCPISGIWFDDIVGIYTYEVSNCQSPEEISFLVSMVPQTVGQCGPGCTITKDGEPAAAKEPAAKEPPCGPPVVPPCDPTLVTAKEGGKRLPVSFTIPGHDASYLFYLVQLPKSQVRIGLAVEDTEEGRYPEYANGGTPVEAKGASNVPSVRGRFQKLDAAGPTELSGMGLRANGPELDRAIPAHFFVIVPNTHLPNSALQEPTPADPVPKNARPEVPEREQK